MFIILLQQILGNKLLLAIIGRQKKVISVVYSNYNNNLLIKVCCENVLIELLL